MRLCRARPHGPVRRARPPIPTASPGRPIDWDHAVTLLHVIDVSPRRLPRPRVHPGSGRLPHGPPHPAVSSRCAAVRRHGTSRPRTRSGPWPTRDSLGRRAMRRRPGDCRSPQVWILAGSAGRWTRRSARRRPRRSAPGPRGAVRRAGSGPISRAGPRARHRWDGRCALRAHPAAHDGRGNPQPRSASSRCGTGGVPGALRVPAAIRPPSTGRHPAPSSTTQPDSTAWPDAVASDRRRVHGAT